MKKTGDPSTEMHCIVNQQCVYRQKSQTKTTTRIVAVSKMSTIKVMDKGQIRLPNLHDNIS